MKPGSMDGTGRIPVLSFFTGAGFLDLGFEHAGFTSIWHNEFVPEFVHGFESGMLSSGFDRRIENTSSILDIGPNQIAKEAFGGIVPPLFGMIGGPPCPDFSVGGKNRGRHGDNGKLSGVYVDRILEIRPAFFVFENVPGLFRTKKHQEFFLSLVGKLGEHYYTDWNILNALEYGVPQDRQRVILFGIQKKWARSSGLFGKRFLDPSFHTQQLATRTSSMGHPGNHWFPWDTDRMFPGAKKAFQWPTSCPFGMRPKLPPGVPEVLTVWHWIGDLDCSNAPPNQQDQFEPYSPKFSQIAEGDTSKKSFKRLHRWRYSPAVAYGNNEVHLHPSLPRRLSVREALRIQTIPDNYVLPADMPLTQKFKTVGNGVPFLLARSIARSIRKVMTEGVPDGNI